MQTFANRHKPKAGPSQKETVAVRFTPDPSVRIKVGEATEPDLGLPKELTYGCVEWFDYKNHPL